MTNLLADSASAYLRSASHQPIHWQEFSEAAFQRAKDEDKLILLDIGAVWCHWCHVIDRESYENDDIAALINAHYVPIKVDRDQRPDIDARYQQIIAQMTGQGGWPLTGILTYDGRVLFGGTYFPPETMKRLLERMKDVYQEEKSEIMKESLHTMPIEMIHQNIEAAEAVEAQKTIPDDVMARITDGIERAFDTLNGGFGAQPKFPHYSALELLIQQAFHQPEPTKSKLKNMIEKTLTQMATGGIYDHIGGGFHRYSVDAEWHVPHFEKMAYDNAEALKVYAQGYRLLGNPLYRDVVEGILHWSTDVLSNNHQGGFYASQDADIDLDDDGDYFTWSIAEIDEVLTAEEAKLICAYYDLTDAGDMGSHRVGRNVLWVKRSAEDVAQDLNLTLHEFETLLTSAQQKMREKRLSRQTPFIDTTLYLNWNGMMLTGLFEAADLLDDADAQATAKKTLDRLRQTHVDKQNDVLWHSQNVAGFLEDYAWWIAALIKGYHSLGESVYLEEAQHWLMRANALFEDKIYGGYYDIPQPEESALALLRFRRKPGEDTPSSSANAVMIRNLLQLSLMTDNPDYQAAAEKGLKIFAQALSSQGLYACALVIALYEFQHPPLKATLLGGNRQALTTLRRVYYPGKLLTYQPSDTMEVRLCVGTHCLAPLTDLSQLDDALDKLAK